MGLSHQDFSLSHINFLQRFHPSTAGAQSVRFEETGGHRMRTAHPDPRAIRLPTADRVLQQSSATEHCIQAR